MSCGYGKKRRIEGRIGRVVTGSFDDIFLEIDFKEIEPRAKTAKEAKKENLAILGRAEKYIAFQIVRTKKKRAARRGP